SYHVYITAEGHIHCHDSDDSRLVPQDGYTYFGIDHLEILNTPPTACFDVSDSWPQVGETVYVDASCSSDVEDPR
ncbi:MAG: hypothetical protein GTO63_35170, partial [Anaerolineae bacterium]|nr:hypothetical protein [Anaerolineae bacterium]NIN99939.1 hypothetical protein [Anaerolineae bacterium]NIQ82698.1 hypothetical protein [Anaerolineae bacterium]